MQLPRQVAPEAPARAGSLSHAAPLAKTPAVPHMLQ
jgi:hypothetical protein